MKKQLPFIAWGVVMLIINAVVTASGVSAECQAEIRELSGHVLEKIL